VKDEADAAASIPLSPAIEAINMEVSVTEQLNTIKVDVYVCGA
jgi:hypothetical protein